MINDELAALLEGCHRRAEVRLAVALPGLTPVEMTVAGITATKNLLMIPGHVGDPVPGTVWLLSGIITGPLSPWYWHPEHRRLP
jgi:hypothetical protein